MREGDAILRGETGASRSWAVEEPKVAEIRARYGLSQARFATLLGISFRTLQNWEQGRRSPRGPAKVLLQVAAEHPTALLDLLRRTG